VIANREELLFQLALSKPAAKRAAWLDAECEGDAALRARLEALLAAHEQPETLLATQAETARPTIKLDLADLPRQARAALWLGDSPSRGSSTMRRRRMKADSSRSEIGTPGT